MHYNPIRSVVAVACAIIFATLFANQGQKTETSGGERAGCPAPPRPAGIAEHVGRPELMSMAVGMPARPGWVRQELRLRPYPLAGWIALQQASSTSQAPCTPHPSLSVRRRRRMRDKGKKSVGQAGCEGGCAAAAPILPLRRATCRAAAGCCSRLAPARITSLRAHSARALPCRRRLLHDVPGPGGAAQVGASTGSANTRRGGSATAATARRGAGAPIMRRSRAGPTALPSCCPVCAHLAGRCTTGSTRPAPTAPCPTGLPSTAPRWCGWWPSPFSTRSSSISRERGPLACAGRLACKGCLACTGRLVYTGRAAGLAPSVGRQG